MSIQIPGREVAEDFRRAATLRHRGSGRFVLWEVDGITAPLVFVDRQAALTFKEQIVPEKEFSKWNVVDCHDIETLCFMTSSYDGKVIVRWRNNLDGAIYGVVDLEAVEVVLALRDLEEGQQVILRQLE